MFKNTACYSSVPITVQADLRVRKCALRLSEKNAKFRLLTERSLAKSGNHCKSRSKLLYMQGIHQDSSFFRHMVLKH